MSEQALFLPRLPALRHVHLLMNVLHSDVLVSARSLAVKRKQALVLPGRPLIARLSGTVGSASKKVQSATSELLTGEGNPGLAVTGGSGHA
jgi:hypothetical protein